MHLKPLSPSLQLPTAQSELSRHVRSSEQPLVQSPPQSMSGSLPSLKPFVQLTHTPIEPPARKHTPDVQCPLAWQPSPSRHCAHTDPPQSTSVSSPSCRPFTHDTHRKLVGSQIPDAQSLSSRHCIPSSHAFCTVAHAAPPQSMSVSRPLCSPSEQSIAGVISWH